jgi:hypothetical protein
LSSDDPDAADLAYCGLFDDFAARYDRGVTSLKDLNQQLLFAVLFGDRLLVNDGYVAVHPGIRKAVADRTSSPFRQLAQQGYVKILTRNGGDLGSVLSVMAEADISSASPLLKDAKANKEFVAWTRNLQAAPTRCFVQWPKYNTSAIFKKIAARALTRAKNLHPAAESDIELFRLELKQTSGRRTEWEDTAGRLLKEGKILASTRAMLMSVANDAYQYAWGCALSGGTSGVHLQMRPPLYVSLAVSVGTLPDDKREPVSVFVPNLKLARKRVHSEWDRLAAMADSTHDVALAKRDYRETLKQYYATNNVDEKQMRVAADAYSTVLAEHFKSKALARIVFDVGAPAAAATAGLALTAGPLGAAVGFAVGVTGASAARMGGDHWTLKMTPRRRSGWINEVNRSCLVGSSSFEIDKDKARKVLEHIPPFLA